jgi:serine/threonine protein kinase
MSPFGSFLKRGKKDSESATNSQRNPKPPYKKGNFIGQRYEVLEVLGKGGFGVVYKVRSPEVEAIFALKALKDEFLADAEMRQLFRREANVWVSLDNHPYIVRAYFADEVNGRLYIGMRFIAPNEQGLNSLEGYLACQPPDLTQSLKWAIQFCYGMEYAYSKGVRCHRDIKPSNIMISSDKKVQISDFGLAGVLSAASSASGAKPGVEQVRIGLSIMEDRGCGTPTHMPPEQFTDAAACDQRSDIYAFGVVLYQMAAGGRLPFLAVLPKDDTEEEQARFGREMYLLHSKAPVPKLNSLLFPIIRRCLIKQPPRRYVTFRELRLDLELLLKHQTGETFRPPEVKELDAIEWSNKGASLANLGRFEEAMKCYDKALEIDPQCVGAWVGRGIGLDDIGRLVEAVECYDKALKINPNDAVAWCNKGVSLGSLGRVDEELSCFDKALKEDKLGRKRDAVWSFRKFIELAPAKYAELIEPVRQRLRELE